MILNINILIFTYAIKKIDLLFVGKGPTAVGSLVLVTGNVSDDLLFFCCLLPPST